MNTHRSRSLQLSTAWIVAIGANLWAAGVTPNHLFANNQNQPKEQQFFPTTDPRGYLTLLTLNGSDGRPDNPDAWNTNSRTINTKTTNTSVTYLAKLPGQPTDWRMGVTGGSNNGPASGAYPVMVAINDLPIGMVTLDASGGIDTQWTPIGQLAGKVRVTLTWGEGTGELASSEPFNLTSIQFARPFRDPDNAPLTGGTTGAEGAHPAQGQPGGGGATRASSGGGGGGGGSPINFPEPTDPLTDPDLAPPDPHDRRTDPPFTPPGTTGDPSDPPPPTSPPTTTPPPSTSPPPTSPPPTLPPTGDPPPPTITDPPELPTPGAIFPLTLGGLALLHRRRPLR